MKLRISNKKILNIIKFFMPLYWKQRIYFSIWISIHQLPTFLRRAWQLWHFRRISQIAYDNTHFYHKSWEKFNTRPKGVKRIRDLEKFPVVDKNILRAQPLADLTIPGFPESRFEWENTSGSTGEPFKFAYSRRSWFRKSFSLFPTGEVYVNRFLYWRGVPFYKIRTYKLAELLVRAHPYRSKSYGGYLHLSIASLRENPADVIARLREYYPDLLHGRATALVELARHVESLPTNKRPRFQYVLAQSEPFTDSQRKYINRIFGVSAYDRYGLEEVKEVGMECDVHYGCHIHEESYLVEILDKDGRQLPPGGTGRIVVTDFFNYVMPFIRYDTGDIGFIVPGRCPCGLNARRLIIERRMIAGYFHIGGKRINIGEIQANLGKYHDLFLRCQIAKTGASEVEIRILTVPNYTESDIFKLKSEFTNLFGLEPKIVKTSDIPFSVAGKTLYFVDETPITSRLVNVGK